MSTESLNNPGTGKCWLQVKMAQTLPGDLTRVIAVYATFPVTVLLLSFDPESTRSIYSRNGDLWRTKAQYETYGFTLDPSVVPDWLLYYRIVNNHHFGQLIAPYPPGILPNIEPNRVTHFVQLSNALVYVTDDGYLHWAHTAKPAVEIRIPGIVRTLTQRVDKYVVVILFENGKVMEASLRDDRIIFRTPELGVGNYFIVDIAPNAYEWRFLTRGGYIGSQYFEDSENEAPPTELTSSEAILLTGVRGGIIDRFGNSRLATLIVFPVVALFATRDLILTPEGELKIRREDSWQTFGDPRLKYIGLKRVTDEESLLITASNRLLIYDSQRVDVISMPRYEDYTGRVESSSKSYILAV